MKTIKELVKDHTVSFSHYRSGNLYYNVDEENFQFPVPIEDTGEATFPSKEKAMLFMRYIRKQHQRIEDN